MTTRLLALVLLSHFCTAQTKYQVEGTVTELATNAPVEDAEVTLAGSDSKATAQTDKTGHFSFHELKPADYVLYTQKAGYGALVSEIHHIHLGPEAPSAIVDFKLPREAVISGRITNADKTPVIGIRVNISKLVYRNGQVTWTNRGQTRTDTLGQYRFARLDEGKYFLYAESPRPEVERLTPSSPKKEEPVMGVVATFYPNATSVDGAAPIYLRTGEERREVDMRLGWEPTHCVSATLDSARPAVANLWLPIPGEIRTITGAEVQPGKKFRVCGLGEGSYKFTLGTFDSKGGAATMITTLFTLGRHNEDLGKLTPAPGVQISGRVFIDGAKPEDPLPPGIVVWLAPTDELRFITEKLDATVSGTGAFEISNLLGGSKYWLSVYHVPPEYYVRSATYSGYDARRAPITPGDGTLDIYLAKDGATIQGRAVDKKGKPEVDVDVALTPVSLPAVIYPGLIQSTHTDQTGAFQFKGVAPGDYKLIAVSDLLEEEIENPVLLRPLLSAATDVTASANGSSNLTVTTIQTHLVTR